MPFTIRPHRRFLVQCVVTYNADLFLKVPLAYFASFGLLIILLLLSSKSASYGEWVKAIPDGENAVAGEPVKYTMYIDPDTIRHKESLVKRWELLDFNRIQTFGGKSYLSKTVLAEYDCAEEQHRFLAIAYHSLEMGHGEVVYRDEHGPSRWMPVIADSVGQALWKLACGKK